MYNYYKIPCKLTGNGIMFPIISETHIFSHLKISEFIKIPFLLSVFPGICISMPAHSPAGILFSSSNTETVPAICSSTSCALSSALTDISFDVTCFLLP